MRHVHSMHRLHSVSKTLMHATVTYSASCQLDLLLNDVSSSLIDRTFLTDLQDAVRIHSIKTICKEPIDPQMLASNWGIGIETAKRTLKVMTYHGLRMVPHPTLSRRLQMTDSHSIVDSLLICLLIFCFRNSHHFREINALKSFGLRMVGSGISLCFSSMKM